MYTFSMIDRFVNGYEEVDYRVLKENGDLVLYVYLPGVNKSDVSVKVNNNTLSVTARNKIGYDKWEYSKEWLLPRYSNLESINSKMVDGVLRVRIPTKNNCLDISVE